MKREGKSYAAEALETQTWPSSSGCRRTSSAWRGNSANSSRNSTPLCASDTSPGTGCVPPPRSPMELTVWCGARNGRRVTNLPPPLATPATECMRDTSSASSTASGGSMDGMRRASIVFPDPGEPIIRMLCPPATATSIACLAFSWPFTSAKSSPKFELDSTSAARLVRSGSICRSPFRYCTVS